MAAPLNMDDLRVKKVFHYDSDESGHFTYILQVKVDCDGYFEWRDVQVVDERGRECGYD